MIPGVTPVARDPLAALPPALNAATPDPFIAVLAAIADGDDVTFVLRADPFDATLEAAVNGLPAPSGVLPVAGGARFRARGGVRAVHVSDIGHTTGPADVPAHTHFPGRLLSPLNYRAAIPAGGGAGQGTAGALLVALDSDAGLDDWLTYEWGGRRLTVLAGFRDAPFDEFAPVYLGIAEGLSWDEAELSIRLRNRRALFDGTVPAALYAGTGGAEGGPDLAGTVKPVVLGTVRNVAPVLLDAARQVYQVGQGPLRAVDAVRDRGVALAFDGDVADAFAAAPAPGSYVSELGRGLIRLAATPAGRVTADSRGPAAAGDSTGAIVRHVATVLLGANALPIAQLDNGAFARLDTAQPAPIGVDLRQPVAAAALLDALMAGIGGWWSFGRDGLLTAGVLSVPADPVETLDAARILSIARLPTEPPVWRQRIGHSRSWTVQGDDDLAGGTTDADREFSAQPIRYAEASDTTIRASSRLAEDVVVDGYFAGAADAGAEAARRLGLFGIARDRYRVEAARGLFRYRLGDSVRIRYPRFGLDAGRDFRIVGLLEDVRLSAVVLELWG